MAAHQLDIEGVDSYVPFILSRSLSMPPYPEECIGYLTNLACFKAIPDLNRSFLIGGMSDDSGAVDKT